MANHFELDTDEAELLVDMLAEHGDEDCPLVHRIIAMLCEAFDLEEPEWDQVH